MTISILGCGWFGIPLAKSLIEKGHLVKGSTTSDGKLMSLTAEGIGSFKLEVTGEGVLGDDKFFDCDVLIISITPKMREGISYQAKVKMIVSAATLHAVKKIILISSTGVYGEYNARVDELTTPNPDSDSGKAILEAEEALSAFKGVFVVIRFGGLIGPGRHPGRFLAGKRDVANGLAPVNLIHLEDCIGICTAIIENTYGFNVVNAVCPDHPTREEFYTLATRSNNMEEPTFIHENAKWKIVDSKYLSAEMDYNFSIVDLKRWLNGN